MRLEWLLATWELSERWWPLRITETKQALGTARRLEESEKSKDKGISDHLQAA